jgi:ferredoxin
MKAKVNPDLCNGMAVCEQTCPEVFEVKEGTSTVKVGDVPSEAEQSCRQAAEGCPTAAISIDE